MAKILVNKIENGVQLVDVSRNKTYTYTVYPFHCDGQAWFMSLIAWNADVPRLAFKKSNMEYDTTDEISCNKNKYIQNLIRIVKAIYAIGNINRRNNTEFETYCLLLELLYKKEYVTRVSTEDFCIEISRINYDFNLTKPMVSKIIASLTENDIINGYLYDNFRAYVVEINNTKYKLNPFFEKTISKKDFYTRCLDYIEDFITYQNIIEHIIKNEVKFTEQVVKVGQSIVDTIPQEYQRYIQVSCRNISQDWYDLNRVAKNNLSIAFDICNAIISIIQLAKDINIEYNIKKLKSLTYEKMREEQNKLHRQKQILEYSKGQEKFVRNQRNIPDFENEKFKLFIPKDYVDCVTVGEIFHNCFADYEWRNYLYNGYRYGMTIIDKATNKHIICLDVNIRSREIVQWLGPCNKRLDVDGTYHELYDELQAFLKANLPKKE